MGNTSRTLIVLTVQDVSEVVLDPGLATSAATGCQTHLWQHEGFRRRHDLLVDLRSLSAKDWQKLSSLRLLSVGDPLARVRERAILFLSS